MFYGAVNAICARYHCRKGRGDRAQGASGAGTDTPSIELPAWEDEARTGQELLCATRAHVDSGTPAARVLLKGLCSHSGLLYPLFTAILMVVSPSSPLVPPGRSHNPNTSSFGVVRRWHRQMGAQLPALWRPLARAAGTVSQITS